MAKSVIKKVIKFGSRSGITALQTNNGTWVAPQDGFIHVTTNQSVNGTTYVYLYENNSLIGSIALLNGTGGLTHAFTVPVMSGATYKILFSNVTTIGVDFRPIIS